MNVPAVVADGEPAPERADVLLGRCPAMQEVYKSIGRVAPQDVTVLIRGESGTGKELVARAVYQHSRRADKPFAVINCAAIPETLLEAELFGVTAGAFTDAKRTKPGLFETAAGCTLFLDEIDALPLAMQSKLLTALEAKRVRGVGAVREQAVDVKVVAATPAELSARVAAGQFRADLYHRLAVLVLTLPPLRERGEDIVCLAQQFLQQYVVALDYAAMFHQFRREEHAARGRADAAIALCTEHGFAYYLGWATIIRGWTLTTQDQGEEGLSQMHQRMAALRATGGEARLPYYLALLAEAHGQAGQAEAGLTLLAEALARAHNTGENWWKAELYRLQGELLLSLSADKYTGTETCFHQALDIARRQQAKALELRAAMSLVRLWQRQGQRAEARELLAEIYGWFTEGFDTADLRETRALLEDLSS